MTYVGKILVFVIMAFVTDLPGDFHRGLHDLEELENRHGRAEEEGQRALEKIDRRPGRRRRRQEGPGRGQGELRRLDEAAQRPGSSMLEEETASRAAADHPGATRGCQRAGQRQDRAARTRKPGARRPISSATRSRPSRSRPTSSSSSRPSSTTGFASWSAFSRRPPRTIPTSASGWPSSPRCCGRTGSPTTSARSRGLESAPPVVGEVKRAEPSNRRVVITIGSDDGLRRRPRAVPLPRETSARVHRQNHHHLRRSRPGRRPRERDDLPGQEDTGGRHCLVYDQAADLKRPRPPASASVPAAAARRPGVLVQAPKSDIFVAMLGVALGAILLACLLMLLILWRYDFKVNAKLAARDGQAQIAVARLPIRRSALGLLRLLIQIVTTPPSVRPGAPPPVERTVAFCFGRRRFATPWISISNCSRPSPPPSSTRGPDSARRQAASFLTSRRAPS